MTKSKVIRKFNFSKVETKSGDVFVGEATTHLIGFDSEHGSYDGALVTIKHPGMCQDAVVSHHELVMVEPIGVVSFKLNDGQWVECDPELDDALAALSLSATAEKAMRDPADKPVVSDQPAENGGFVQVPFGEAAKFAWLLGHQTTEMEDGE